MKFKMTVAAAFLTLGVAACQTSDQTGPSTTATASVPAEYAAFEGVWVGKVDGHMDASFQIRSVKPDGKVSGTYKHGSWPRYGITADSTRISGTIVGRLLTLKKFSNGGRWELTLLEDGEIEAVFTSNTGTSYARLRRS